MKLLKKIRFICAAICNDDTYLRQESVSQAEIIGDIKGKTVALVGNARALAESNHGAQIEKCDVIIRINRAPMPSPVSHGSRTDWLALATSLSKEAYESLGAQRLMWMSHKRKRLAPWMASGRGFFLFDAELYREAQTKVGAQPTTGALLAFWLSRQDFEELHLFGFDFFSSRSLSGSRTAQQVPHDFNAEEKFVMDLVKSDQRITLHPLK